MGVVRILAAVLMLGLSAGPIQAQGRITIGGDFDYPPYEYIDADGRPAGYNVALTRALADAMGFAVDIRLGPWEDTRQALADGRVKAIHGMFFSPARDRTVDFSTPHTIVHHAVFLRKGDRAIESPAALNGRRVIVMAGDIMHDWVVEERITDRLITAKTQAEALRMLAAGRGDCALVATLPGRYWIKTLGLDNLTTTGPPLRPSRYCYAVREGDAALLARFNEGLAILKNTGRYQEIYDRWLGVLDPPAWPLRRIALWASAVAAPLLLGVLAVTLWNRTLKQEVARRTAALDTEITERRRAESDLRRAHGQLEKIFNSIDALVYIADMKTHEVYFLNDFGEKSFGRDVVGRKCFEVFQKGQLGPCPFCTNDQLLDDTGAPAGVVRWEYRNPHNNRWYDVRDRAIRWNKELPVRLEIAVDITERKRTEDALRTALALNQHLSAAPEADIIAFGLEEGCRLTDSPIGYFHLINDDQRTIRLTAWSDATLKQCRVDDKATHYPIAAAGIWVDAIKARRPVRHNDYDAVAHRKGLPEGHVPILRDLAVPVVDGDAVVAVMGVGNKGDAYTDNDAERLSLVAETIWGLLKNHRAESALRTAHDELESRVVARTAALSRANTALTEEVTERRRVAAALRDSETHFHQLFDAGFDAMVIVDTAGAIFDANAAACGLTGLDKAALRALTIADLHAGRDRPRMADALARVLDQGTAYLGEMTVRHTDGRQIPVEAGGVYFSRGERRRVILSYRDISARKLAEAEAQRAHQLASLGEMAAGVAHEINNPINGIINYGQLLADDGASTDSIREIAVRIIREGDRVADIVRNLLSFARDRHEEKIPVSLEQVLQAGLSLVDRQLKRRGIRVSVSTAPNLPMVLANPQQIQQVIMNLLYNARDALLHIAAADQREKTISIELTHQTEATPPTVRAVFQDNGCGIAEGDLDRIFHPFFTTKPTGRGTGLGLSISHGIVSDHGGRIRCTSQEGVYTRFTIDLPVFRQSQR